MVPNQLTRRFGHNWMKYREFEKLYLAGFIN